MFVLEVLIPVHDNEKVAFPPTWHHAFGTFLLETFGGYTKLPGTTQGAWIETTDDGRKAVYTDESFVYLLSIDSITDGHKVVAAVDFAKRHYRQKAIFLRYLGVAEIL